VRAGLARSAQVDTIWDGHVVGEDERWSNCSSNAGAPVREHDAEVWADTKSLGKGKRSLPREGLRHARRVFSL
jgi:hypothetical protein